MCLCETANPFEVVELTELLANALDLELAWKRVLWDHADGRTFFVPPFLRQVIADDLESWLDDVRLAVQADAYQPSALRTLEVPKPRGAIRPGCVLTLRDHTVYSALLQCCRPEVQDELAWGDPPPDFAYRFHDDVQDASWFKPFFSHWRAFDKQSIEALNNGAQWVVTADVAGYYELIDLHLLRSDLRALDVDKEVLNLLFRCLHRWSETEKRGVPQGHSPSDILAKLYLNSVDRSLRAAGFIHYRWVDDFRIFAENRAEARRALLLLTGLLRSKGLVLQSTKTRILHADEARPKFRGIHAVIEPIRDRVEAQILQLLDGAELSLTTAQIDRYLGQRAGADSLPVLEEAYRAHVQNCEFFDKTAFRFLLNRLGSAGSEFAWRHAMDQFVDRPEETGAALEYARRLDRVADAESALVAFLQSEDCVYDYQVYQALSWRMSIEGAPSEEFMGFVRRVVFGGQAPWYVRAVAMAIIGKCGSPADLERLISTYGDAGSEDQRVGIIAASTRFERGRRNAFLGHASGDGEMCAGAARLVRAEEIRWE